MRIILPKTLCIVYQSYGPLFFLAGPIGGGDDWQTKCCKEIENKIPDFYAAIPCRYKEDHPLYAFKAADVRRFERQLIWERHYLAMAAYTGCIIFWLPEENKTNPKTGPNPYAMDTRGELGEWRGRMKYDNNIRIVIGAEAGFPGIDIIKRNFNLATGSDIPIYETLAETVAAAIKKTEIKSEWSW